jgi:Trypsin-co-occurring domain 1
MSRALARVQIGEVELLVETERGPAAGSEQTGRLRDSAEKVVDAFDEVQTAVIAIAGRLVAAADAIPEPTSIEVEFGLKFTAEGNVVLAGASAEASLSFKMTYDRSHTPLRGMD